MKENMPPIALAGLDQVIVLPKDSVYLDGSGSNDPDGTMDSWLWTKLSGPRSFEIANAADSQTIIRNLTEGYYSSFYRSPTTKDYPQEIQ